MIRKQGQACKNPGEGGMIATVIKAVFFTGALLTWVLLAVWLVLGERFERGLEERRAEILGGLAGRYVAGNAPVAEPAGGVQTVAGLYHIPVAVDRFQDNIFRATGVANSYLIQTTAGNVLFDTGLATQAAKHKRLLQAAAPGDVTHIILSHSHADHTGGVRFWRSEYPEAQIITHRRFAEGQRYLTALQTHFWNRNRLLYDFMPAEPPAEGSPFAYGGIEADLVVADEAWRFTLGDVDFVVLPAPGAEGDDNIVLWLPAQKALFSGDFFGPLFPMVPNLFTLRGEKFRDPVAYVESLDRLIALQPELILPSHFAPHSGRDELVRNMRLMRDATAYIHDRTLAGMNAGKTLWQLMREIELPPGLAISQGHGKVSWNVRSIWEHYSTWFRFESTTELYPVPVRTLYPELANLAGGAAPLLGLADEKLTAGYAEQALHLVEIALAAVPGDRAALGIRLAALEFLLARARESTGNFSETGWLDSRIRATRRELEQ